MSFFDKFPYTNFHELNMDWIIKKIKSVEDSMKAAKQSEINAKQSETNAAASEKSAKLAEQGAHDSAEVAHSSALAAQKSETDAAQSATRAEDSAERAETAADRAEAVQLDAEQVEKNAQLAQKSAAAAKQSETNAKASETNAKASEDNAAGSEASAAADATRAENAASRVEQIEIDATTAIGAADRAAASATAAKQSETNAKKSEEAAKLSETNSKESETIAKTSALSASESATNAQTAAESVQSLASSIIPSTTFSKTNIQFSNDNGITDLLFYTDITGNDEKTRNTDSNFKICGKARFKINKSNFTEPINTKVAGLKYLKQTFSYSGGSEDSEGDDVMKNLAIQLAKWFKNSYMKDVPDPSYAGYTYDKTFTAILAPVDPGSHGTVMSSGYITINFNRSNSWFSNRYDCTISGMLYVQLYSDALYSPWNAIDTATVSFVG